MYTYFVRLPCNHGVKHFVWENNGVNQQIIRSAISSHFFNSTDCNDFLLYVNGKELSGNQDVYPNETVHVSFKLPGGKGGFGSMLRAIGAQIEKTTNREACRDLSGRRLRDINEEQRLKKWISKKAEREAEKIKRRKERIERLKSRPKHNFVDFEYEKEISNLPERVDEALTAGLQKVKRPLEDNEPSTSSVKKKHLWLDEEISESSDSDSEKKSSDSDLEKSSSDPQCDESLDANACCSTSINKTENLASLISDERCAQSHGDENCSTSSDEQKNTLPSDVFPEGALQSECTDQEVLSPKSLSEGNTLPGNSSIEKSNELSQPKIVGENPPKLDEDTPINLDELSSVAEIEALGLQRLKSALMERGLKCGGNIVDRAQRLWAVRGLLPEQYPKNLLAKSKK